MRIDRQANRLFASVLYFVLISFSPAPVFSQSPDSQDAAETDSAEPEAETVIAEPAVPFVSGLDLELKNGFIRLVWKDSPEATGPVYIYRLDKPLHATEAALPHPFVVPYGMQTYTDEAERPGTFYYLAAASDESGRRYTASIPFTNTISVSLGEADLLGYASASKPGAGETGIRGLNSSVEYNRIVLTFQGEGKKAILYRNTRPIRRQEDLLQSVIVNRGFTSPLNDDFPVPGIPYYYALILEDEIAAAAIPVKAGTNATLDPVEIPLNTDNSGIPQRKNRVRTIPLPAAAVPGLETAPGKEALSKEADKALRNISVPGKKQIPFREPGIFLEDLEESRTGESGRLGAIVQGSFKNLDWEKTGEELRRFLLLPHSAQVESRSRFYLGQAYYFTGKPKEALFEFLAAQTYYPNESNPWIDAVLARLVD